MSASVLFYFGVCLLQGVNNLAAWIMADWVALEEGDWERLKFGYYAKVELERTKMEVLLKQANGCARYRC